MEHDAKRLRELSRLIKLPEAFQEERDDQGRHRRVIRFANCAANEGGARIARDILDEPRRLNKLYTYNLTQIPGSK